MKAVSPGRAARRSGPAEPGPGAPRGKRAAGGAGAPSLPRDMSDCYSRLKALVPSIPRDRKVSRMEILQHVIDYILDLQLALDAHPAVAGLHRPRPAPGPAARPPLTTLNTDIRVLSLQAAEGPPATARRPAAEPRRRTTRRTGLLQTAAAKPSAASRPSCSPPRTVSSVIYEKRL